MDLVQFSAAIFYADSHEGRIERLPPRSIPYSQPRLIGVRGILNLYTIDPPQRGIGVRGININISDFTGILINVADA